MKIECVLELMQEKGYIEIYEHGEEPMPLTYIIENHRGKEFGQKLFKAILDSGDYLVDYGNRNFPDISIAKKSDIDEWLETIKDETTKIRWIPGRLDYKLFEYMEKKNFEASKDRAGLSVIITNLKVKNERLKRIEAKNQEAIDLLDQLL